MKILSNDDILKLTNALAAAIEQRQDYMTEREQEMANAALYVVEAVLCPQEWQLAGIDSEALANELLDALIAYHLD